MKKNKTFLIAGASSGIGLAIKNVLLSEGHKVIGIVRKPIDGITDNNFSHLIHDFSDSAPLPDIAEQVDGLVYCPGTINLKPFASLKGSDIVNDFNINVLGAFNFIHKYYPLMRESSDGSIILFSSVAVQTGMPFHASVAISKGGIEGLTKSLAAEFSPKIRVNCIAPSLTDTPLAKNLLNSEAKRTANAERHPLKRIGEPEEIASLATYLLTDAKWITGQIIGINGGLGSIFK